MGLSFNFLKQNPEIFIAKKVIFFSPLLLILLFIWADKWYFYVAGLLTGIIGSLIKLFFMGSVYSKLFLHTEMKKTDVAASSFKMLFVWIFSFILLALSAFFAIPAMIGTLIGLMVVPLVISINSITEYFGITQNKFGCR